MDGSLATLVTLFATLALLGSASAQAPAQDVLTFYEVTIANAASCTAVDRQAAWLDTAVEFLECPQGWEGVTCSREVDECEGSPCENGATCTDMLAAFSCTCAPGWTGDTCAQKTVMGTLTDTVFQYWADAVNDTAGCTTLSSFLTVVHTELMNGGGESELLTCSVNECDSQPCQHNGTCFDGDDSYHCDCVAGFQGHDCEDDYSHCLTGQNSCSQYSQCYHEDHIPGVYHCRCLAGYSSDASVVNCTSGWPCMPSAADAGGDLAIPGAAPCQDIDECASSPCQNGGTCSDSLSTAGTVAVGVYECACAPGWASTTGQQDCAVNTDQCNSDPCQHGATCVDDNYGYTCTCVAGWHGTNCDTDVDECASVPCQNGATCSDSQTTFNSTVALNSYTCVCVNGYQGTNCATDSDECGSSPCVNGGTCYVPNGVLAHYSCACAPGYEG